MENLSSFYAELYDQEHSTITRNEFAQLLVYVRQVAKGAILEPMCGSGRFLIPLCEQKLQVEGLDICPFMLDACRAKLAAKALTTNLYLQNIEQMDLPHRYDLIFILSQSLSMLKKEQLPSVFQKIYDHLHPGAFFIFDLWAIIEPNLHHIARDKREFKKMDGSLILRDQEILYDPSRSVYHLHNRYKSVQARGQTERAEDTIEMQLYDKKTVLQLIEKNGFSVFQEFDQAYYAKINEFVFIKKQFLIVCKK